MLHNPTIKKRFWPNLYKIFFLLLPSLLAAKPLQLSRLKTAYICYKKHPLKVYIAQTEQQKRQGLSELSATQFGNNVGMLFIYQHEDSKRFWMPKMHFRLNIIFLDARYQVVGIERNLAYPTPQNPTIKRTNYYRSQYVLEIRPTNRWGKALDLGDQLTWCSPQSAPLQKE